LVAVALGALLVTSCSSGGGDHSAGSASTSSPAAAFTPRLPDEIAAPPVAGKGINLPQPAAPLPPGYTMDEFFVGGTATSFTAVNTPDDGAWTVKPGATAKYRTRVIVRRPPADKFSGTVVVEWLNVTAIESSPEWAFMSQEIGREGDAYIGVSAQAQGVEGGKNLLNVNVNQKTAASLGVSLNKSGLKHIDPVRYGSLVHPGDAYAYDMFSQIGRAAAQSPGKLLGGLVPKKVVALGESQSAAFLTTLIDAVHPIDPAFDGFLIHSRGQGGAPLDGNFASRQGQQALNAGPGHGLLIRTDQHVPVFIFETETDLTLLGYSHARQPDSTYVHTWENAGLSHADAHFVRVIIGGPRDPNLGKLFGCPSINTGPQHEVVQAALRHVTQWVAGGAAPPSGTRLQLVDDTAAQASIARDANGNARGGVRNPLVDVPTATLTGEPPPGTTAADFAKSNGTCLLFGHTIPFTRAKLVDFYGTADHYVAAFRAAADKAVAAGFLLRPDADALIAEAEANRALFG
jgi:hypothetical protein